MRWLARHRRYEVACANTWGNKRASDAYIPQGVLLRSAHAVNSGQPATRTSRSGKSSEGRRTACCARRPPHTHSKLSLASTSDAAHTTLATTGTPWAQTPSRTHAGMRCKEKTWAQTRNNAELRADQMCQLKHYRQQHGIDVYKHAHGRIAWVEPIAARASNRQANASRLSRPSTSFTACKYITNAVETKTRIHTNQAKSKLLCEKSRPSLPCSPLPRNPINRPSLLSRYPHHPAPPHHLLCALHPFSLSLTRSLRKRPQAKKHPQSFACNTAK